MYLNITILKTSIKMTFISLMISATCRSVDDTYLMQVLYYFPPILLSLIQTEWLSLVIVMMPHNLATELPLLVDTSLLHHEVDWNQPTG